MTSSFWLIFSFLLVHNVNAQFGEIASIVTGLLGSGAGGAAGLGSLAGTAGSAAGLGSLAGTGASAGVGKFLYYFLHLQ